MKKQIFIYIILAVLLFSGCELRNRMSSSNFIPETHAPRPTETEQAAATEAETQDNSTKELTRHSVRTVAYETATYTDIYGKEWTYEFRLPFVDYPSLEASDTNIEIDRIYRRSIDEQIKLAELEQPVTAPLIDYECYYTGTLITLNVWMEQTSGVVERSVYCFRSDGTMATPTEILEAVWIDTEEFAQKLYEELEERYIEENADSVDYVTYNMYLEKTLMQTEDIDQLTLYANAEDKVTVFALLYDAHGGLTQIELNVQP